MCAECIARNGARLGPCREHRPKLVKATEKTAAPMVGILLTPDEARTALTVMDYYSSEYSMSLAAHAVRDKLEAWLESLA